MKTTEPSRLFDKMRRAEKAHEMGRDLYELFPSADDLTPGEALAVGTVLRLLLKIERETREEIDHDFIRCAGRIER